MIDITKDTFHDHSIKTFFSPRHVMRKYWGLSPLFGMLGFIFGFGVYSGLHALGKPDVAWNRKERDLSVGARNLELKTYQRTTLFDPKHIFNERWSRSA